MQSIIAEFKQGCRERYVTTLQQVGGGALTVIKGVQALAKGEKAYKVCMASFD